MESPIEKTINHRELTLNNENGDLASSVIATDKSLSLRKQLLISLISAIGIPLALAAFWGYQFIAKKSEATINSRLYREAILAQDILTISLKEAAAIPLSMASNPAIIEAVKTGSDRAINDNLTALPISVAEKNYNSTKLLQPNNQLNNYLQELVKNSNFTEIFFTEKFGFNIAYSQPTSDFVQRDEAWWQRAKSNEGYISEPSFDDSTNAYSISIVRAIREPQSQEFIGVIKAVLPISYLSQISIDYLENINFFTSQQIQIIDTNTNKAIATIKETEIIENPNLIGSNAIATIGNILQQATQNQITTEEILTQIPANIGIQNITVGDTILNRDSSKDDISTISFRYSDRQYTLAAIPNTSFVISASIDRGEITTAAKQSLSKFLVLAVGLFLITTIVILVVARQISNPLKDLAIKAQEAASGNLEVRANPTGTRETIVLAYSFNNLIERVKHSIEKQSRILQNAEQTRRDAEIFASEQQEKNARIQQELLDLLEDVEGASSGDLTVRSRINDGEIGIVADFFNSIIESLRDIVAQVKEAAKQVNVSVGENQSTIGELATEASQQADRVTVTLASVEQIARSIQQVAHNAQEAAQVAHIASNKAQRGGESMEHTVSSIQQLRGTIDRTADKVKSLGEASQKISRVISLINQIAMQTNLLAINASIEAARAGEEGKGFAVVAEEVGELATQSSEATKEVGTIIAEIQKGIFQVVEAMEVGIIQAEEGTRLVEGTKDSLQQIVEVSYQIDRLIQSISQTTVSQAETSENVTELMEQIALISERTSDFSQNASESLESTVEIAQKLQLSVNTFKIEREEDTDVNF